MSKDNKANEIQVKGRLKIKNKKYHKQTVNKHDPQNYS